MSNNISDSRNSNFVYGIIAAVLGLIGFFGIILNLFVIVVIIKKSRAVWTPINITLVNLACGDFLVALLGDPFAFVSAYNRGWYWSHATCIWYAWFMSSLGLSSIGHLTVLAIERWFMIVKPMQTLSVKSSLFLAAGVWLYGISLSLPPLIGWGKFGYEAANISCSVSWELHDPSTNTDTYIAFLFFFGFIAPVTLICFSYTGIVRTLKKVKKRTEAGAAGKRERQVTLMVALMIIAFLFAWTPYATFALASQYFSYQLTGLIAAVPSILAKSSICYNPIIYAGLNPQFRKSVKKMFGCKDSQQKTGREAKPSTVQINVTTKV